MKNNIERTFAMIKALAVKEKNTGKIIELIEATGFNIVELQKILMPIEKAKQLYAEHVDKPFFQGMLKNITSGKVVILCLEKENAINDWRQLMGATNPSNAAIGTLRNLFGHDIENNATHGSDSSESAKRELSIFF